MSLNRSIIRAQQESQMLKDKEEDLALFLELRKHDKERDLDLDSVSPGSRSESSSIFNIVSTGPLRRTVADEFLNSDGDKNDYDWLLTPPGTPLFPSLEMESQRNSMSQLGTGKIRPTALKSRLASQQQEPAARSNLLSKSAVSPVLTSSSGTRRPSSSSGSGSRPGTPSGRTTGTSTPKTSRPSTPTSRGTLSSTKPINSGNKSTIPATRSTTSTTKSAASSRSSTPSRSSARSSTPIKSTTRSSMPSASTVRSSVPTSSTARSSFPSGSTARSSLPMASTAKSCLPTGSTARSSLSSGSTIRSSLPSGSTARSSLPSGSTARSSLPSGLTSRSSTPSRSTGRSSTPSRSTARPSTPSRSTARSSTPTARPSIPSSKSTSRAATPTRRPSSSSSASDVSGPPTRSFSTVMRNPVPSRGSSPMRSRPWNPSEMPGFSLEAPPNLRTTLPDRPLSATRGRPGAPSSRSSSIEPGSVARARRQSCSPSRGRLSNGSLHTSGSSVPAVSRHSKVNDDVSPVVIGTKMVERVINMRKLAPPKPDDKHSPTVSGKSISSPDSSGFGRTLSKKSLDMAIRHMDIRRSIPGNLRPLMTNIPASSMYSVRSGPPRSKTASVSDSPLATSSNASSELSVNNNGNYLYGNEVDDEVGSERGGQSPTSVHGQVGQQY